VSQPSECKKAMVGCSTRVSSLKSAGVSCPGST
jgi:hypothetical protein